MKEFFVFPDSTSLINGIITRINNLYPSSWEKCVKAYSNFTNYHPGRKECQSLVDRTITGSEQKDEWCSVSMKKPSFTISFLKHKVFPYSYSLQAAAQGKYPVSWYVEASNDALNWKSIDTQNNVATLKTSLAKSMFILNSNHSYKHFRFTQTLSNLGESSHFCMKRVELFGHIYSVPRVTCNAMNNQPNKFLLYLLMFMSTK